MNITKVSKEDEFVSPKEQLSTDVLMGLCSSPKGISSMYFYDDIGSSLFQKITQHDDYYLTRTEYNILSESSKEIAEQVDVEEIDILELGAGDGHKSQLILQGFLDKGCKVNYYPIDISAEAMNQLENTIKAHDNLSIHGVVGEYLQGLNYVRRHSKNRQLVLFLGSNIGNFDRVQNQVFLRKIWKTLNSDDYILSGFDLKKDVEVLTAAYNDSSHYTRDFNINILTRINKELGANFDVNKFQHFGVYNPLLGAMESYLLSLEEQSVFIEDLSRSFHFNAFEPLHLEYSFKFLESEISELCHKTGFKLAKNFTDKNKFFIDSLWQVRKNF